MANGEPSSEEMQEYEMLFESIHYTHKYIRRHLGHCIGQRKILKYLDKHGAVSQQELQSQLQLQSSSISDILPKLESGGFITRTRDGEDRRRWNVEITEAGLAELQAHALPDRRRLILLFSGLPHEERTELIRLLGKLRACWEEIPAEAWEKQPGKGDEACI